MFKKYLNDTESKEAQNLTNFFIDVETYHKMNAESKSRTQRDTHAQFIFKFASINNSCSTLLDIYPIILSNFILIKLNLINIYSKKQNSKTLFSRYRILQNLVFTNQNLFASNRNL